MIKNLKNWILVFKNSINDLTNIYEQIPQERKPTLIIVSILGGIVAGGGYTLVIPYLALAMIPAAIFALFVSILWTAHGMELSNKIEKTVVDNYAPIPGFDNRPNYPRDFKTRGAIEPFVAEINTILLNDDFNLKFQKWKENDFREQKFTDNNSIPINFIEKNVLQPLENNNVRHVVVEVRDGKYKFDICIEVVKNKVTKYTLNIWIAQAEIRSPSAGVKIGFVTSGFENYNTISIMKDYPERDELFLKILYAIAIFMEETNGCHMIADYKWEQ